MRLYSTPESVRAGEPSILAIVETLAAMAVSVWIGVHFDTWWHVAIGASIAPLLLLRTDDSCQTGIRLAHRYISALDNAGIASQLGLFLPHYILIPVAAIGARLCATMWQALRSPISMLGALPMNWWRNSVALDCAQSPEWLPLPLDPQALPRVGLPYERVEKVARVYGLWAWAATRFSCGTAPVSQEREAGFEAAWRLVSDEPYPRAGSPWLIRGLRIFLVMGVVVPVIAIITMIAFAYRWSLKSTAIVWLPMLWAVRPVKPPSRAWRAHLEMQLERGIPQLVAVVSLLCLVGLFFKYVVWALRSEIVEGEEALRCALLRLSNWVADCIGLRPVVESPLLDAVISFVQPGKIPPWDVTIGLNALLGIFVWWQMCSWRAHFRHDEPPSERSITRTLAVAFFFRHLFTSYIILCDLIIAWNVARKLPIPSIRWQLLPDVQ